MLMQVDKSCVLLVDVQEGLIKNIYQHQRLIAHCHWLLSVAKALQVPIAVSEQYPKGLRPTVTALREIIPEVKVAEKVEFSGAANENCLQQIKQLERKQIIMLGIEAHVCVLQTAVELKMQGKEIFVVADAVSSRDPRDTELALQRMRNLGIQIVSKEMVVFEWLRQAGTPLFKKISKEFLH